MVKPTSIPPENAKKADDLKKEKEEVELPPTVTVIPTEAGTRTPVPPTRQRGRCTPIRCCLILTLVLILVAMFAVGGFMLAHRFGGDRLTCGVTYREPHSGGRHGSSSDNSDEGREHQMDEELDIDPDRMYERIEQPENDQCERITILHDYNVNVQLSAYKMWNSGRCYVKKLNQTVALNPQEFWEKMKDPSFFNQHFETLVETYRVVLPPMDHFGGLGMYIPRLCWDVPTYWLEKVPESLLDSWLDNADDIMDLVDDYVEEVMEEVEEALDDVMDDDELIFRKRRAVDAAKILDDVINWTGKHFIDMKVVKPEVTKALQKAGKLDLQLPEKKE